MVMRNNKDQREGAQVRTMREEKSGGGEINKRSSVEKREKSRG